MKRMILITLLALFAVAANAQQPAEMKKLDWLVGEWRGEGWFQMGPQGKREQFLQHERVTPKAGGKALLVEGTGHEKLADGKAGKVVHDALGVMSWDPEKKVYNFNTWVADKPTAPITLEVPAENMVVWSFAPPPGGTIRYTMRLTEKGEWNEVGEYSRDGQRWSKFFEMNLTKVK